MSYPPPGGQPAPYEPPPDEPTVPHQAPADSAGVPYQAPPTTPFLQPGTTAPFAAAAPSSFGAGADAGYAPPVEAYQPPDAGGSAQAPGYGYAGPAMPAYPPPYAGPGMPAYPPPYAYAGAGRTNGLAIASLVCSLGGLVTCISAPVGIVLGHVARRQIRERGEDGAGLATAGLVIGYVLTGLAVLILGLYLVAGIVVATKQS
jgi:hypothetical protein